MEKTWISVNDEPIPVDVPSLIMIKDGTVHVGYPGYEDGIWIVGGWESCSYCGGESRIGYSGQSVKTPINWMPIPRLPSS